MTLTDVLHHELHHCVDRKVDQLGRLIKAIPKKLRRYGERGDFLKLDYFFDALYHIRNEAYPKLFDSSGQILFSTKRLLEIRARVNQALFDRGGALVYDAAGKRIAYLGTIHPGDDHYSLARYMAFIIAYSLMDENTLIAIQEKIRVKNIAVAFAREISIMQPPLEQKRIAGEIIRAAKPLVFVKLFETAAKKLHLSEEHLPLSLAQIRSFIHQFEYVERMMLQNNALENLPDIRRGTFEKQLNEYVSEEYQKLLQEWRMASSNLTFYEFKQRVEEIAHSVEKK